jgi:adenine deaminase
MELAERIGISLGQKTVDLLLKNAKLVNVLSGEVHDCSVAVHEGIVVGFGDYDAAEVIDLENRFIVPGLIDGHLHLESSMLSIPEFAANVVPLGTTTVIADPHEIANVMGVEGIRYILDSSEDLPLNVYIMFPSCVPATPFETSGADLGARDMEPFTDNNRVLGLAEMMNYPGVLFQDPEVLAKIEVFAHKILDGHAPGLGGKDLCAYVAAGIRSDHECTTLAEARQKMEAGMHIMIREGSAAKNLDNLLPLVNDHNSRNCSFVTDDLDPGDIIEKGHINRILRMAVAKGLDPVRAIQMATINTARYFRLRNLGAIAPGYLADILVMDDLKNFAIKRVFKSGRAVAADGRLTVELLTKDGVTLPRKMNVAWDKVSSLAIPAGKGKINIIQVIPGQIVTKRVVEEPRIEKGCAVADSTRDILKIAVIERHRGTGSFAAGFIKGFGLSTGAVACTVAHDSHNIIVVGENDQDMMRAAHEVADLGGGMAVVKDEAVLARLPLPIAGLMSDRCIHEVKAGLDSVVKAAHDLGCKLENPFATLSFMALTPIPELKLTDKGLFDSQNFRFTPLFEG